ncbi:MAG: putative integral membrane protein (TIGR00698 family) [Candidatus Endobugula sp.]|jgi:uncharacterized integral membrane protein (TIGR00698 family)
MIKAERWSDSKSFHRLVSMRQYCTSRIPGLCFCLVVVLASSYISEHYGSSQILGALLLGMALHNISQYPEFAPGLEFCAKVVLKCGVALLGVRIAFSQITELGFFPIVVVSISLLSTLLVGVLLAYIFGLNRIKGVISAAAVAICGVSAALAVASLFKMNKETEKHLLCTVLGVTGLSTICMILYPGILLHFDLRPEQMGIFLGASIHDVAQVFGAGEMISSEVSELATYTKMLRVALLMPVIMVIALFMSQNSGNGKSRLQRSFPPFLIAFVGFVILANSDFLPKTSLLLISDVSQICLWISMAALGAKTNLIDMWQVGKKPMLLLFLNTLFIAIVAFTLVVY